MATQSNSWIYGPVDKLKILSWAAQNNKLSRSELAVLIVLANGMNSKTGVTWRSCNKLAFEAGASIRMIKRSIKTLQAKGYLVLEQMGGRSGKANTFRLPLMQYIPIANLADKGDENTMSSMPNDGAMEDPKLASSMTPLSMTESEPIARIERSRLEDVEFFGVADAPLRRRPTAGVDMYPEFWAEFPFRSEVFTSEKILNGFILGGVDLDNIVDGARRYKVYCQTVNSQKRTSAASWLNNERWRDAWNLPSKPIAKSTVGKDPAIKKVSATKKKSKGIKNTPKTPRKCWRNNPEHDDWWKKLYPLITESSDTAMAFNKHVGLNKNSDFLCAQCNNWQYDNFGAPCLEGINLNVKYFEIQKQMDELETIKPAKQIYS